MGNAIVYCSGCRKQLRQAQFDEGDALHLQDHDSCARCAGHGKNTTRILRALAHRPGYHARPRPPGSRLMGYLLGAAGIVFAAALLLACANASRTGSRPALPAANQQR